MSADPQRYCLACGYNLGGLTTHRCPECGRTFNPHDAATYTRYARRPSGWPHFLISIFAAATTLVTFILGHLLSNATSTLLQLLGWAAHVTMTVTMLICAAILLRSLMALLGPNEAVRHRHYFLAAFLLTLYPTAGLIWLGLLLLRWLLPT